MKQIMIIGCGFPQLSLIRAAKQLGLSVFGVDLNSHAVAVPYCDSFEQISTSDVQSIVSLAKRANIRAITTTGSEVALRATVAVCEAVGAPFYADIETVRRAQEKDAMRAAYAAHDVAVPPYLGTSEISAAKAFAGVHGYPLVVKPARGWGQRGVARVDCESELLEAFAAAQIHARAAGLDTVLIEAWLEGGEYSVNGWIENGRLENYCVTKRITIPGKKPLGIMIAELFPSGLNMQEEAVVVEEARRGAHALGLRRGPCYSQVAFARTGASGTMRSFLFETAARCGGGFDADVTQLASGVNFYERIIGIALDDLELERSPKKQPAYEAAVAKFLVGTPGVVRSIRGLEQVRTSAGIHDAQVFVPVGGTVHPLTDSAKRAAYVLASGDSATHVLERADEALARIQICTEC